MSDDPLRDEHEAVQRAILAARRKAAALPETAFTRAMMATMDDFRDVRKAGVSLEDAVNGIETVLRDVWPHKPSKFPPSCEACDGTRWRELTCWDGQRCGRERCVKAGPAFEHRYVVPCECWQTAREATDSEEAAIARAVRATRKPRPSGFTRFGR